MSDVEFTSSILLPGIVSLSVSLITLFFSNSTKNNSENNSEFKNDLKKSCRKIHYYSYKEEPHKYEEDFLFEVSYLLENIKASNFIKDKERKSVKKMIRRIKYQFSELTKESLSETDMMAIRTIILNTLSSIKTDSGIVI